jgi:hypothetical protein
MLGSYRVVLVGKGKAAGAAGNGWGNGPINLEGGVGASGQASSTKAELEKAEGFVQALRTRYPEQETEKGSVVWTVAKEVESLRAKLRAEAVEAPSEKGPAGRLGNVRKLQGKLKRLEEYEKRMGNQGREAQETLAWVGEAQASNRVELQATRASLKQANEAMVAEGVRTGVSHNTVVDSLRSMVPEAHAGSEAGQMLGKLIDQAAALLQQMRGDMAEEDEEGDVDDLWAGGDGPPDRRRTVGRRRVRRVQR